MDTWFITGCSTGIGRSLAHAVLTAGFNAAVTARDPGTLKDIIAEFPQTAEAIALDVTDKEAVWNAVGQAEERFGGIDVLVNNAGFGYRSSVEEADDRNVEQLFATNFFGPVSVIKAALPAMRKRGSGTIVNVSSIGARISAPGLGFYSATKFAVEGMSDALRQELAPLGIRVLLIEPGGFQTDFSGRSMHDTKSDIEEYESAIGAGRSTPAKKRGDPERAAQVIIDTVSREDIPIRLLLGSDAVGIVGPEIDRQRAEIAQWSALSVTTDFPKTTAAEN